MKKTISIIIMCLFGLILGCKFYTSSLPEPDPIEKWSYIYKADPNLMRALRWAESRDGKDIHRCEMFKLTNQLWVKEYVEVYDLEKYGDGIYSSWGDWQLLFLTAHWYGYQGRPEDLVNYETNCKYANMHMGALQGRFKYMTTAITTWNSGSPKGTNGRFNNQAFVDEVVSKYEELTDG